MEYPAWLEIADSNSATKRVRYVGRAGSVRTIQPFELKANTLEFSRNEWFGAYEVVKRRTSALAHKRPRLCIQLFESPLLPFRIPGFLTSCALSLNDRHGGTAARARLKATRPHVAGTPARTRAVADIRIGQRSV